MPKSIQPYQVRVDRNGQSLDLSFPEMTRKPYVLLTFAQAKSLAKTILQVVRDEKQATSKGFIQTRE